VQVQVVLILNVSNETISAVIDKSFFQMICSHEVEEQREDFWQELFKRYQIIVPFILLEEVMVNFVKPVNRKEQLVAERMGGMLEQLKPCWMDEEIEIAYRELVLKSPVTTLPPLSQEFADVMSNLSPDDPDMVKWVERRAVIGKQISANRARYQAKLLAEGDFGVIQRKEDFLGNVIKGEFNKMLKNPKSKMEMLEIILGNAFRQRHSERSTEITAAFERYTFITSNNYPVTTGCILARLTYNLAPLFKIGRNGDRSLPKILGRNAKEQRNNLADEKYVASGLMCDRVITCDRGMKTVLELFEAARLWQVKVVFFQRHRGLMDQMALLV
jgi:hypothetical protein